MGLFKKQNDVIDFTEMQRREVTKKSPEKMIDFSSKVNPSQSSNGDPNDFFGSLAGANNASSNSYGDSIIDNLREARQRNQNGSVAFNEMKIKLEDAEFRISQLSERVRQLETKLREYRE